MPNPQPGKAADRIIKDVRTRRLTIPWVDPPLAGLHLDPMRPWV